jgi:hypothetical protein
LSSVARQEYLFVIENILFLVVLAILFAEGSSVDERFLPGFLELLTVASISMSELSNTSLDALCIRPDEAEFVLFLFKVLLFVFVVFILLLRFIVRIVVIATWVRLDNSCRRQRRGARTTINYVETV